MNHATFPGWNKINARSEVAVIGEDECVTRAGKVTLIVAATLAALSFLWLGVANWVDASRYASLTSGVQALGVVTALAVGVATLMRDSRDRRVDRVLALHHELMTGDVWQARYRLVGHLRVLGRETASRSVSREELINDPDVSRYKPGSSGAPITDADLLMRFFERANAARRARSLHLPLFAELIGRHALWWNAALSGSPAWLTREPLTELAAWTSQYVETNRTRNPEVEKWIDAVTRDFSHSSEPSNSASTNL